MDELQPILEFFGLREQPFAATADPVYFYATRGHRECLFRLWNSIDQRHGIAVVLGNYGTGKTTLLRKLLTGMKADRGKYNTAVIASPIPSWTSFALLESVVTQFGLQPPRRSFMAYIESLNRHLMLNRDRVNTLIIDDAQNLNKRGQLELLRLAQNLETAQHKLLNLVCFAQMEWSQILSAAPNFAQRINLTYVLDVLSPAETGELIAYRLQQAGSGATGPQFTDDAVACIHAYAEGSPRLTVTLCRNVLVAAARAKTRVIGPELVVHTIDNTTLPDPARRMRVAALVEGGGGAMVSPAPAARAKPGDPAESPAGAPPPGLGMTRDDRARQMLLRSGRPRS